MPGKLVSRMSERKCFTLSETDTIKSASQNFDEKKVGCMPVLDKNKNVIGIFLYLFLLIPILSFVTIQFVFSVQNLCMILLLPPEDVYSNFSLCHSCTTLHISYQYMCLTSCHTHSWLL